METDQLRWPLIRVVNLDTMKITWKRISLVALCVILAGGAYIGYQFTRAWRLFSAEDQIAHAFYPVVEAIYGHVEAHGHPPERLADMVPETLPAIPECPVVDSVSYHVQSHLAVGAA
jgi:hypothetical protein